MRQRRIDDNYIYFQTTKKKLTDLKRVEVERRLTMDEYLRLLMEAEHADTDIQRLQAEYLECTASDEGMNCHERRAAARMQEIHEKDGVRRLFGYEKFL